MVRALGWVYVNDSDAATYDEPNTREQNRTEQTKKKRKKNCSAEDEQKKLRPCSRSYM